MTALRLDAPTRGRTEVAPARHGRATRDIGAFVAGVLVLAVGLGLGPRHAAKEGVTPTSVLGFALVAASLLVVAWSVRHLLVHQRRRWQLLTIPVLLVTAYVGTWTLGQAVAASFPPRPDLGSRTPADLDLAFQSVAFPAEDGVRLAGWYLPARNGAAVVLLHGAGSTRTAVLDHAAVLNRAGYGVLLFDARGHGRSAGHGMDFGWYGESDVVGAIDFLASRSDLTATRVGLVGMSMGGEEAIGAAGIDDRVAAVVAEGATNRVSDDKAFLDRYGVRGRLQQGIDRVTYALTELLTAAPRPRALRDSVADAATRGQPTSFLLVTAGDLADERHAADLIRSAAPGAVEVWTVPDAGHTAGLRTAPDLWEDRVVGFLDRTLANSVASDG
jgi:pimeloyl-ACP methyl ester carboxylesterase